MPPYRSITIRLLQALLALFFAIQGIVKLAGSASWIARFQAWGYPAGAHLAVGAAEVLGAVLLLIPGFARFGALVLLAIMIGATGTHLFNREPQIVTTLIVGGLLTLVVVTRR